MSFAHLQFLNPLLLVVLNFLTQKSISQSGVRFNAEGCTQFVNIPPKEPLLEREHCSICELIVTNSQKWNWHANHYDSLCEGVPPHAKEWCMHYSCRLAECPYFTDQKCQVIKSMEENDVVEMSPCPPKYVCSYCLQIPRTQVLGCFDSFLI